MTALPSLLNPARDVGGPAQPLLAVRRLVKHFTLRSGFLSRAAGSVQAVDDVSFDVRKGETLGIVGESGCGKSTTLRLVMGLLPPTSGEFVFDGLAVDTSASGIRLKDYRRQVQMVFQDSYASLNPRLTVEESIAFAPVVHGLGRRDAAARARELLDAVGLNPVQYARRYPHELSGGQRQRVNIARSLALRPRLVILDEPVSALDKSVEAQVLNLLVDLKAQLGLTYLFVSHDLNVVHHVSDRVLVMYLGRVVEIGPVGRIYDAPAHPYTAALLASRPSIQPGQRRNHAPITGDPPSPVNPPAGCRFHPRCAFAEPVCARREPVLCEASPGHLAACLIAEPGSGHSRAGALAA